MPRTAVIGNDAVEAGKRRVISGFANKFISCMTRYLPDLLSNALVGGKAKQFRNAE